MVKKRGNNEGSIYKRDDAAVPILGQNKAAKWGILLVSGGLGASRW